MAPGRTHADEIICALKVATVDEALPDPRFHPGGRFGHLSFNPRADRKRRKRAVRDRYLSLAAVNDDHFVFGSPLIAPWLSQKCCQAFHDGFVMALAHGPAPVVLGLVDKAGPSPGVSGPSR